MLFGYSHAGIRETEIVEFLILAEAVDGDLYVITRIGYGIVGQVAEDRVEK